MAGAPTALARLGIGTADPVDTAMNFSDFDIGVTRELRDISGTRGTFFSDGNRVLENRRTVAPRLSCEPTATELAYLLQWIMSGTPTGSTTITYPWSNTAQVRNMMFAPTAGEQWFLAGVGVDTATFRASSGEPLSVDLDLLGQTFDATRTNMPSLTYDQTLQPFILSHLALTMDALVRPCRSISFTVRNGLDRTRFLNSLTLTSVLKEAGGFNFSVEMPSGDNAAQFWASGVDGVSVAAVFTNPTTTSALSITIADCRLVPKSPTFAQGAEGFLTLEGMAVRVTTADPVVITLKQ